MTMEKPFALLKPKYSPPRLSLIHERYSFSNWSEVISLLPQDKLLALDFETRGIFPLDLNAQPVGVALAGEQGVLYLDFASSYQDLYQDLMNYLVDEQIQLIGHNVFFDGIWPLYQFSLWLNWRACTYGMYRHLAAEGFEGQKWSLKNAQMDLLCWEETNERYLDEWLVESGFKKQNGAPDKSQMWQAPPEILGHYCRLDAESTFLLYREILQPVEKEFQAYSKYHTDAFLPMVRKTMESYLIGTEVDERKLFDYSEGLTSSIVTSRTQFMEQHENAIEKFNNKAIAEFAEKSPTRFLKQKEVGQEPNQYTKAGALSKNWTKWFNRKQELEGSSPQETTHYKNWKEKVNTGILAALDWKETQTQEGIDFGLFNMNSSHHKQWLFYDHLQKPVVVWTDNETNPQPSVADDTLLGFGGDALSLIQYNTLVKESSYVEKALSVLRPVSVDGLSRPPVGSTKTIHFGFKCPGTITGRWAGSGGFNLQQQPKTRGYLECFQARPGTKWIDIDATALEPCVLTELSRDPSLLKLYGPGVPANDIYLFTGAHIPALREPILHAGYDPLNPTKEGMARAKKECKQIRSICKTVVLASQYGASPNKIRETLALNGIQLSVEEVRGIHRSYWDIYKGVKEYERFLLGQWDKNGGWVLNGIGRPVCVAQNYLKDIINRVVQSTGHDLLLMYSAILWNLLRDYDVIPIVSNWHDQIILEVPEKDANVVWHLTSQVAFERLNDQLGVGRSPGPIVQIKGSGGIRSNLAECKIED